MILVNIKSYKKARIKKFKLNIFDDKNRITETCEYIKDISIEYDKITIEINSKGRFIKLELVENFGEKFFVIGRLHFIVEEIHSIK